MKVKYRVIICHNRNSLLFVLYSLSFDNKWFSKKQNKKAKNSCQFKILLLENFASFSVFAVFFFQFPFQVYMFSVYTFFSSRFSILLLLLLTEFCCCCCPGDIKRTVLTAIFPTNVIYSFHFGSIKCRKKNLWIFFFHHQQQHIHITWE